MYFKNIFLNLFGFFYVIIAVLAYYNSIKYFGPESILWFSYFAFLFVGVGILTRNSYLIGSQINIFFIPYTVWTIDFMYHLLTSNSLWGITDYVFLIRPSITYLVTIQHLFLIPIALISVYFIKFKRKDFWKFSLIQVTIIFFLTRILSEPVKNINCVFKNCLPFQFGSILYVLMWFVAFIFMILAINFSLTRIKLFKAKRVKTKVNK